LFIHHLQNKYKLRRLSKNYLTLCEKKLPTAHYIYFSPHFQPERSTLPEGGDFVDHIIAIDVLNNFIQEGVPIIYKEHPRQFDPTDLSRQKYRDITYYNLIQSHGNVLFADPFADPLRLISGSLVVVTVTGTAGWEALMNGKPVIVFGDPWYRECAACLHVSQISETAIRKLCRLTANDVHLAVEKFLDELYSPLGILVPAFTYSFTKTGIYDRANTPSEVGRFGEEIRLAFPPAQRTMNPVFSVIDCHSILKSDELSEDTAFGRHSLWNHLNEIGHICVNVNLQVPLINLRGVKTKFAGRCCNANPLSQRERLGSILCTVASAFLFRHHLHCRCHGSRPVY
jgi:hypothetical protein